MSSEKLQLVRGLFSHIQLHWPCSRINRWMESFWDAWFSERNMKKQM